MRWSRRRSARFVALSLFSSFLFPLSRLLSNPTPILSYLSESDPYSHECDRKLQGRAWEAQERTCGDEIGGRWIARRAGQGTRGEAEAGDRLEGYEWSPCEYPVRFSSLLSKDDDATSQLDERADLSSFQPFPFSHPSSPRLEHLLRTVSVDLTISSLMLLNKWRLLSLDWSKRWKRSRSRKRIWTSSRRESSRF